MRIAGLDPGKMRDGFAMVACEIKDNKLYVKGAKRWLHRNYTEVEREIKKIHDSNPFDHIMLEVNNTGQHVYEVLKYDMDLPVSPVTTSNDLKDLSKKDSYSVMDKNEMVRTMSHWFNEKLIIFPRIKDKELSELQRQISIFAQYRTEAGNVSYRAQGNEHDDLVMALMLVCFMARKHIGRQNFFLINVDNPIDFERTEKYTCNDCKKNNHPMEDHEFMLMEGLYDDLRFCHCICATCKSSVAKEMDLV